MIGRWLSPLTLGTIDRSSVFRVESSNVRTPRSQRITWRLPWARMYSADISRSLTVALIPRLSRTGSPGPADLLEQVEVLHVPGADLEDVGVPLDELDLARVHDLGDDRHAELLAGGLEDLEAVLAQPLEAVGAGPGLERPAAEDVGPGLPDPRRRSRSSSASLSMAQGPAIITRWPPPILTPLTSKTESSRWNSRLASLNGLRIGTTCSTPGDRLQGLDLELLLVADDADDRPRDPLAEVGREAQGLDPLEDVLDHLGRRMRLQHDDHLALLVVCLRSPPGTTPCNVEKPKTAARVGADHGENLTI